MKWKLRVRKGMRQVAHVVSDEPLVCTIEGLDGMLRLRLDRDRSDGLYLQWLRNEAGRGWPEHTKEEVRLPLGPNLKGAMTWKDK